MYPSLDFGFNLLQSTLYTIVCLTDCFAFHSVTVSDPQFMMPSTTNSSFSGTTEALDVATVFPSQIRGKTILVTGVNLKGIGFTTAEAFVCLH